ncbi:MAG: hypothetical protein PVH68_08015 [Armatimonadota bacterium]|jgi:hypothetical protein
MRSVYVVVLALVLTGIGPAFVVGVAAQVVEGAAAGEAAEVAPVVPLEAEPVEPEPPPIEPVAPDFDFEAELPANWQATTGEATLQITQLRDNVAAGTGALECLYTPSCTISAGNLVPQPNALSLRFSLKTTQPTNLVYGVAEADGSEYQSFCSVPAGAWQQIALDLGELVLAQNSEDENVQLDADQINQVIIGDLANLEGEVGEALGQKIGQQTLWLDNVKLSPDPAPSRAGGGVPGERVLDVFDRPQVDCLAIGGAELSAGPAAGRKGALQATYSLGAGRWVGFVTAAGHLDLAGATNVRLRLRAPQATSIVVVLEERDLTKYETRLELAGGEQWEDLVFPIANFILDDDSQDENGALDLPQVRVMILLCDMLTSGVDVLGKGVIAVDEISFQTQ